MFGLKKMLAGLLDVEQSRTTRLEEYLTRALVTMDQVRDAYRQDLHVIMKHLTDQQTAVLAQLEKTFTQANQSQLIAMAEVTRSARSAVAAALASQPNADPATKHLGTLVGLQEPPQTHIPPQSTPDEVPEGAEPDLLTEVELLGGPPLGAEPVDEAVAPS